MRGFLFEKGKAKGKRQKAEGIHQFLTCWRVDLLLSHIASQ